MLRMSNIFDTEQFAMVTSLSYREKTLYGFARGRANCIRTLLLPAPAKLRQQGGRHDCRDYRAADNPAVGHCGADAQPCNR